MERAKAAFERKEKVESVESPLRAMSSCKNSTAHVRLPRQEENSAPDIRQEESSVRRPARRPADYSTERQLLLRLARDMGTAGQQGDTRRVVVDFRFRVDHEHRF